MHCFVVFAESIESAPGETGALEPVAEWLHAALPKLLELLAPGLFDEARHAALLPKRLRNASMKGSRSPSITLWTSLTFRSVRWSLTIV